MSASTVKEPWSAVIADTARSKDLIKKVTADLRLLSKNSICVDGGWAMCTVVNRQDQ